MNLGKTAKIIIIIDNEIKKNFFLLLELGKDAMQNRYIS